MSIVTESSGDDHFINRDVVSLEVGDEIYAFEKYTPRNRDVDGPWYRGYAICLYKLKENSNNRVLTGMSCVRRVGHK